MYKTSQYREKLPREHFMDCQGVKMLLLKDHIKLFFRHKLRFVIIEVLSQFEFLRFVTNWVLEFCHNLTQFEFLVWSQFESYHILSFVTIWSCHNLSFVTILVLSQLELFFFFKFCHNLSLRVLSQLEFLSFVTI